MSEQQFTNSVELTISEFTIGAIDSNEFKSSILNMLIQVASPHFDKSEKKDTLEESPEHEFITKAYQPSKKGEGDFFTINDLIKDFLVDCQKTIIPRPEILGRSLHKLNYERVAFRKAQYPVYGYWMKKVA